MERRLQKEKASELLKPWQRGQKHTEYILGEEGLSCHRPGMSVVSPLEDGLVRDWDLMEAVWAHGLDKIHADPKQHPILYSEPVVTMQSQREKAMEIMFESLQVPALFPAKSGSLHAFSVGRPTALIVDLGSAHTRVSPVYDGYCIETGMLQSFVGGFILSQYMQIQMKRSLDRGELSLEGSKMDVSTKNDLSRFLTPSLDIHPDVCTNSDLLYQGGSQEFPSGWFPVLCGEGRVPRLQYGAHHVKGQDPYSQLRVRERLVDNYGTTMSFETYRQIRIAEDIKRAVCRVALTHYNERKQSRAEETEKADEKQKQTSKREEEKDVKMDGGVSSDEEEDESEDESDEESSESSEDEENNITYDMPYQRGRLNLSHEANVVGELLFDPSPARPMDWQTSQTIAQEYKRRLKQQQAARASNLQSSSGAEASSQQTESSQRAPEHGSGSTHDQHGAAGDGGHAENGEIVSKQLLNSSIRYRVTKAFEAGESTLCVEDDMDLGIDFCHAAAVVNGSLTPSERVSARQALRKHGRIPRDYTSPTRTSMFPEPLHDMVYRSLNYCDPDIRKTLVNNIVLVGGGSRASGLKERLYKELDQYLPNVSIVPIVTRFSCWLLHTIFPCVNCRLTNLECLLLDL